MGIFSAGSASVNIVPDFSGTQRAIARWFEGKDVTVRIKPELNKAELAKTDAEIERPRKMHVHIDVDKHQLLEAADFLTGFSTVGKVLKGMFSPKVLGLTDAVGAGGALLTSLAQIVPVVALLPAGIAALAAPIATITVGVQGMGDAFKALASGDINQINKAMANLAPSARDFVTQMHALAPAFHDLRLDVQQQLFEGLGEQVSKTAKLYLPILHVGLGDIAVDLNAMASQFLDVASSAQGLASTKAIFTNLNGLFGALSNAVRPITEAFLTLTQVGSNFLPGFGQGLARAADAFNKWIQGLAQSGKLTEVIQTALDRLKELFDFVFHVGQLVFTVFKPALTAGSSLLQLLDSLVKSLTAVLSTPVAQSSLREFFDAVAKSVQILMPGIEAVVQALVVDFLPIAGKLLQALAPLINGLLTQFADLLNTIAPLIYPTLVNALSAWLGAVSPLIPIFGEIAQAILPVLAKVLQELAPVIGQIASQFGTFLATALKMIAPLLMQLGDAFVQIVKALLPLLPPIFELIQTLLPPLIQLFEAIIPVIVQIVQAFVPLIVQIAQVLTPILKVLAEILVWAFQTIIGPVILYVVKSIIIPMIQTVIDIVKALWQDIQFAWTNIIKPVWDALGAAAQWLWQKVVQPAFQGIRDAWNWLSDEIGRIYHGAIEPIWTFIKDAIDTVKHGFQVAVDGIQAIWHGLIHALEYPVQLAIDFVWNNTLRKAWNLLNNLWGGKDLDPVTLPGMDAAEGAVLPGFTPGRDVHHFYSPSGGRLNLSGGEAIMVPEFTRAVGPGQIMAWNRQARAGAIQSMLDLGLGYAGGGIWPASNFGSNIGLGDRSLNWAQSAGLGTLSVIVPFLPGGQLVQPLLDYVKSEAGASGDKDSSPIAGMIGATLRNALNNLWGAAKNLVLGALGPDSTANANYHADLAAKAAAAARINLGNLGSVGSLGGLGATAGVQAVMLAATPYGWNTGPEWSALQAVIMRESGFNPTAQNPTSSAYGMFQFLDGTWATVGGTKTSDAVAQGVYGMRYIAQRYRDPLGALAHEQQFGWYDFGGHMPPGWNLSYNGTGGYETVLNSKERDVIGSMLSGASGGAVPTTYAGITNSNIYVTDLAELDRVQRRAARRTMVAQAVTT